MLNNCTFQGRFAADPEMRTTQSGLTVASFRMAVDRDNVGQDRQVIGSGIKLLLERLFLFRELFNLFAKVSNLLIEFVNFSLLLLFA